MADQLALRPGDAFTECELCPVMIVVPSGNFIMGSMEAELGHDRNEWPQHHVTFAGNFGVGKFEVTVRQFVAFLNAALKEGRFRESWIMTAPGDQDAPVVRRTEHNQIAFSAQNDRDEHPVTFVSWIGAIEYAKWLSRQTGAPYRLLTEAEWEYAARAGSTTVYHFGDDAMRLCEYGNVADISGLKKNKWTSATKCEDGYPDMAPAGKFQPNSFGLYDMIGNAAEWVEDCVHRTYDGAPADGSAWIGAGDCNSRIVRGGSFQNLPAGLRSAQRYANSVDTRSATLGFRVARSLPSMPWEKKAPEQRANAHRARGGQDA
jgi:formylglycine-generating enzyme required for sulfatase activity